MTFCVLVTSADSRKDIFDFCFANFDRIWKDCPWPRFAKFGTFDNWCQQVTAHVNELPPEIQYILLMVEDVLFMQPVDNAKLQAFAKTILRARIKYLRLVPLRLSWLSKLSFSRWHRGSIEMIPPSHPYYSSTEMVIWQRDYLLQQLAKETDAWRFEHLISETEHFAVTDPVFDQHQIVQKGRWNWEAPYLMAIASNTLPTRAVCDAFYDILRKTRPFQTIGARLRGNWQNLNFALFGFTSFRIKRWIRSLSQA